MDIRKQVAKNIIYFLAEAIKFILITDLSSWQPMNRECQSSESSDCGHEEYALAGFVKYAMYASRYDAVGD